MTRNRREPECGLGPCKPSFLRHFASVNWFAACYCATSLVTSSLQMYIVSQVTTIERQFGLSSTKTGYLMASNDIGYSLSILIMSYFASRVHIPKFLCYSTILYGVSGIVCSIPYFIAPKPELDFDIDTPQNFSFASLQPLCKNDNSGMNIGYNMSAMDIAAAKESKRTRDVAMGLIAIGMIVQGIGKAPRFPMLAQFMDDNTGPRETGFYMGIISSFGILGPVLAYGLGGLFSQMYVTLEDVPITPRDPRWIGAWWLGFLSFGIAAIILALPLLCFPAKLKTVPIKPDNRRKMKVSCGAIGREIAGVVKSIIKVLKVPTYTLVLVATLCNVMGFGATVSFGPKYMQAQFNVPAWQANIILGGVGLASVCVGSFLGGYLTKKFKLNPPRCIMLLLLVQIPSTGLNFVAMFLHCEQPVVQNWPLDQYSNPGIQLTPSCLQACHCDQDKFFPLCGADGRNYFSPCQAGCTVGTQQVYQNCSCIPGGNATAGLCPFDCGRLWPFNVVSFVGGLISSCMMMPTFIMFLRIVPEDVKSMGIGVSALCMSLFAWLPGPVIGGKLVDNACVVWSGGVGGGIGAGGGSQGYCSFYNIDTLRFNLFGYVIGFRTLSTLILVVALKLCWHMNKWANMPEGVERECEIELPLKTGIKPGQEADLLMKKPIQ